MVTTEHNARAAAQSHEPAEGSEAAQYNRQTYDAIWSELSDFIKYNPGARHRRRAVIGLLKSIRFETLLDVGCGNAELLAYLQQAFPHAAFAGADLSDEVVKQNEARIPGMRFFSLNVEDEALDERFDAIVCSEVIEHLDHRRPAFLHLAEMLNDGGHLVLTAPAGKVYETERYFGHTTHPSKKELRELGWAAGLELVTLENWGWPLYKGLKWATNVNAEWSLKNFADGRYGLREKAISTALYAVNFLNAKSSPFGVQYFALYRKGR